MRSQSSLTLKLITCCLALGLAAAPGFAAMEDPPQILPASGLPPAPLGPLYASALPAAPDLAPSAAAPSTGWKRVSDPSSEAQPAEQDAHAPSATPVNPPGDTLPAQLTVPAGTFIKMRVDQTLASDLNEVGDAFSATLTQPIIVDGIVVAQRGQTIAGRVVEVQKGGRVKGTARLGIDLTELTLVDGQQVPIKSQLVSFNGPSTKGRDVLAVAGTTGLGAAIGGAAEGAAGAGIGAGIGAAAGLAGVLLTRGHPVVIDPETVMTFRLTAPLTVSTVRAPQAFRYVNPDDYARSAQELKSRVSRPSLRRDCGWYGCAPPYFYGGYYGPYYPYYYWGPYWGPSFSYFYFPRYHGYYHGGRGFRHR